MFGLTSRLQGSDLESLGRMEGPVGAMSLIGLEAGQSPRHRTSLVGEGSFP